MTRRNDFTQAALSILVVMFTAISPARAMTLISSEVLEGGAGPGATRRAIPSRAHHTAGWRDQHPGKPVAPLTMLSSSVESRSWSIAQSSISARCGEAYPDPTEGAQLFPPAADLPEANRGTAGDRKRRKVARSGLKPGGGPVVSAPNSGNAVAVTPGLVRQVQFMLLTIGIDPGPIDGVPRQLTNAAVRRFDQQFGLPALDLVRGGEISTEFLDRLRKAASVTLLGAQPQPPPATPPGEPQPPVARAPVHQPPPVDRFAACPFDQADFSIGGTQYTPDTFLQTGFGGSTAIAVDNLRDRLQEARRVAQQIGGPAGKEVQRQSRVLAYFECRLNIEQASANKN
jgi:hypothetical protein